MIGKRSGIRLPVWGPRLSVNQARRPGEKSTGWLTKGLNLCIFNMNILLTVNPMEKLAPTWGYSMKINNKHHWNNQFKQTKIYKRIKLTGIWNPCQPFSCWKRPSKKSTSTLVQVAWSHTLPHTVGHMTPGWRTVQPFPHIWRFWSPLFLFCTRFFKQNILLPLYWDVS